MTELTNAGRSRLLHSWKEIACYLGVGVRTVQRYEGQYGLPVHRPAAKPRSSVAAFADELDAWMRRTSMRRQHEVPDGDLCPLCSGTGRLLPPELSEPPDSVWSVNNQNGSS